jgi:branched-chain amino acid transport system substrate-binding protein
MAEYAAKELGAKKAAILYDTGNDYSIGLKDAFSAKCAELGSRSSTRRATPPATWTSAASSPTSRRASPTSSSPPFTIRTPAHSHPGPRLGIEATFLGGDGWAGVTGYASAEDLEGSLFCSAYASGSTDAVKDFEAAYTAAYARTR